MRASLIVFLAVTAAAPAFAEDKAEPDLPAKLHRYYGNWPGYQKVHNDVIGWHKTAKEGCVAFASTALRHVGIAIPFDVYKDGRSVSRITGAFSRYLSEDLKWTRFDKVDDLRPGDIVFTTDHPCCPGYPAHVMMFDGWVKGHSVARFIDNQGFRVERPIVAQPSLPQYDGFGYFMRPPEPPRPEAKKAAPAAVTPPRG
jgi:hypothetical protein